MKKLILSLLLIIISSLTYAQDSVALEPLSYSKVVTLDKSIPADVIFEKLKAWVAKTFPAVGTNGAQYILERKEIMTKGRIPYKTANLTWAASSGYVSYDVDIRVKDGRFKIYLENFTHVSTDPDFPQGWSIGIIYNRTPTKKELKNMGMKTLYITQYFAVEKRVRPVCEEAWARVQTGLASFLLSDINKEMDDDDW